MGADDRIKKPLGNWPKDPVLKEVGSLNQLMVEEDPEGFVLALANTLGWSREEILVYIAYFRREVRSNKYRPYYWQKAVWGRKPE